MRMGRNNKAHAGKSKSKSSREFLTMALGIVDSSLPDDGRGGHGRGKGCLGNDSNTPQGANLTHPALPPSALAHEKTQVAQISGGQRAKQKQSNSVDRSEEKGHRQKCTDEGEPPDVESRKRK